MVIARSAAVAVLINDQKERVLLERRKCEILLDEARAHLEQCDVSDSRHERYLKEYIDLVRSYCALTDQLFSVIYA